MVGASPRTSSARSRSGSSACSRSGRSWRLVDALPLIECPSHPYQRVALLTANTEKNRGRNFFRCMKDAMRPTACDFFLWEDDYLKYLLTMDYDFHCDPLPREMLVSMLFGEMKVRQLKAEVEYMRVQTGGMRAELDALKQHSVKSSGDKMTVIVSLNVVFFVVVLLVALGWK